MKKIILGLTGKIACGKGTFSDYLIEKYGAKKFGFSDPLKETLSIYDIDLTRHNLQTLSTILRQNFSEDILAKALMKRATSAKENIVIIDGVRRLTDIENFRSLDNFFLVYIDTDKKLRYDRYVKRNQSPGDKKMPLEEFQKKDNAESENQIEGLKKFANHIISNNGSVEQLLQKTDEIIKSLKPET